VAKNAEEKANQGKNQNVDDSAQKDQENTKANAEAAAEDNPARVEYVEEKGEDGETYRAIATNPENSIQTGALDNLPEGEDYVGVLEHQFGPDPEYHVDRQAEANYPRLPEEFFEPSELERLPLDNDRQATRQSLIGRLVVVENDVEHNGRVIKAGTKDLDLETADALIERGDAWEAAGKGMGR
jgi:hypothetical protein